jgi:hypothetical protein
MTWRSCSPSGACTPLDFLLSAKQDAAAAKRFLAKALGRANHPTPRVINTDKHAAYPPAIVQLKDEGVLEETCQHRPVQYLNNVLEQDHRANQAPDQLEQRTYEELGNELGLDPTTLREQLPRFAQELKKSPNATPMNVPMPLTWPRIIMRRSDWR